MSRDPLVEARHDEELAAPAPRIWALLAWGALEELCGEGPFSAVRYLEGGDLREITLADGSRIRERCLAVDEDRRRLRYRVEVPGAVPVSDYRGEVTVEALGTDRCRLRCRSRCRPCGISVDEWRALYAAMQAELAALLLRVAGRS